MAARRDIIFIAVNISNFESSIRLYGHLLFRPCKCARSGPRPFRGD